MYRMRRRQREIRIYVRNKARYNPETKERDFLFVDINDFAGTTIGDIKEDIRRQTKNKVKIDDLFLNNQTLADDRSVAHYNLEDGSILETTSNPFWVSCLYIKAAEVKQAQEGNPADEAIQAWTKKSLPKKYTLIGLLLNSNNAYLSQPPHFPTLLDFVQYLERLGRKGATMHPNYTQADLAKMEQEFHRHFEPKFDDPIAAFIDHHAVQLGFINPDEAERKLRQPADVAVNNRLTDRPTNSGAATSVAGKPRPAASGAATRKRNTNRKQVQICEDCETSLAVVYCPDCQNSSDGFGISLCKRCSDLIHTGATRRRHNITDISQAPKTTNSKPYVPRAFLAPFSILLAMYSALLDRVPQLSMTEDEIKTRAQSLTDTDLQDKQNGKYVGGFDCMENVLMAKGLVKKEAAREPTYALTELGQGLGEKLYLFYRTMFEYLSSCQLPKLKDTVLSACVGNRKICLIIDENEREKGRLLKYAEDKGIDAQTRYLPAGDYIWILTPPMIDTRQKYTGTSDAEVVLPFIVERKSWEDFENSVNSTRFQRQVNNMLGSGLKNCFYLMEGSPGALRYNATQQQQQYLKAMVEKLIHDYGFYVNYTSSWMKSAQWLLWFTQLIVEAFKQGKLSDATIAYSDYSSRVAQLNGGHACSNYGNQIRRTHVWPAQLFIDHIFRDELGDRSLIRTMKEDLGLQEREKHLLIIQGLEQYNKKRQSTLNKCCTEVHDSPQQAKGIVDRMIGANIHNMVHYDITCHKQLYIQVMTGVYIMRTESDADSEKAGQQFMAGPKPLPPRADSATKRSRRQSANKKSSGLSSPQERDQLSALHSILDDLHPNIEMDQDLGANVSLPNSRSGKIPDLPPGCGIANIPNPRQTSRVTARSRMETGQMFKAFSGTGHTLGSGSNSHGVHKPSATVTSENQNRERGTDFPANRLGSESGAYPWKDLNSVSVSDSSNRGNLIPSELLIDKTVLPVASKPYSISLDSGIPETARSAFKAKNVTTDADKSLSEEDFINSQDEEQILQEVLHKSKQDVVSIEPDSQDDPELQLALMLSKEEKQYDINNPSGQSTTVLENRDSLTIEIQGDSQDENDKELKLAIEKSRLDVREKEIEKTFEVPNQQRDIICDSVNISDISEVRKYSVNTEDIDDDEQQLKIAIEMSKQIRTPENLNEKDTDYLIQEAILRSKLDTSVPKVNNESDFQLKQVIENSKLDLTPEKIMTVPDFQLKEAIERSKLDHTPQKVDDFDHRLKQAIDRSKHDHTPKKTDYDSDLRQAIEISKLEHTPKESDAEMKDIALRIALEKSLMDQNPQRPSVKRKLDAGLLGDKKRKLVKYSEENGFKASPDTKSIVTVCGLQNSVAYSGGVNSNNEDIIQIESQSQEMETEETESVSRDNYIGANSNVQNSTISSQDLHLSEDSGRVDGIDVNSQLASQEYDSFLQNGFENLENSSERIVVNSFVIKGNRNPEDSESNRRNDECDYEEDDLVQPSPNKSSSRLNLSQQNISIFSNAKGIETPDSVTAYTKSELQTCDKSFETNCSQVYSCMAKDRNKNNSDFSLKANLLRFVDEEASDDDSFDEHECEDDDIEGGIEMSSEKSVEDIFEKGDSINKLDHNVEKFISVSNLNSCNSSVPKSKKVVTDVLLGRNLVNKNLVQQTIQPLNGEKNFRISKHLHEANKNVSSVEKSSVATFDFVKEIKVEPSDEPETGNDNKFQNNISAQEKEAKENRNTLSEKKEVCEGNSAKIYSQRNSPDMNDYDSEMDEVGFNPDWDDSEKDPDYHADKDASGSSQDNSSNDGDSEDIDDLISKVDPDFLPNISRPKKRRKTKTPEKQSSSSVREKAEKQDICYSKIKVEKPESSDNDIEMDAALAKLLDKQINRSENEYIARSRIAPSNDEIIARQMQAKLMSDSFVSRGIDIDGRRNRHFQTGLGYKDTVHDEDQVFINENDEALARRLDAELNRNNSVNLDNSEIIFPAGQENKQIRYRNQKNASKQLQNNKIEDITEADNLIKEFQRRELEKIERMKRLQAEDEKLAKMLQETQDVGKDQIQAEKPIQQRNYKKLFAEDRALREKSAAQVDAYRQLQSQKYRSAQTQQNEKKFVTDLTGNRPKNAFEEGRFTGNTPDVTELYKRTSPPRHTTPCNYNQLRGTQDDPLALTQNSSFPFSQSQAGQLTPCSQSKPAAERNLNSTCGNCGEKGHTRVNPNCPKYHTAEETARREAQQEKRRQQQEEKKREELENINMLASHQKAIVEMNNQLETEMSTIQNELRKRALDLEKQVNSRVKKIENAEKRKKKK